MPQLSEAAHRLEGQRMFQILATTKELEAQGQNILHFELGDPDFDTPSHISESAYAALKEGYTHYAPSSGLMELREAAAEVTLKSRGFKPDITQLLVTPGANSQLDYAITCTVNPGDDVIVPDPGFVSYFSIIKLHGANPVRIPLREENEFRLNPDDVEKAITSKTKMIIMNSPSNPTGSVMNEREIKRMYEIAQKRDLFLLSDEIYARIIYPESGTKHFSPSRYDLCKERVIIVNGFSKAYAMTGWRLGVVTGPPELIKKMALTLETRVSCVPPFIQKAGVAALKGSQEARERMVEEYKERRDLIVEGLNSLKGVSCIKPNGAFYAFPNISKTGLTSEEFASKMLYEAGVALAPGTIFGIHGEGYARFSYVTSRDKISESIDRMKKVL